MKKQKRIFIPEYNASAMVSEGAEKNKKFMAALKKMCRLALDELKKQPPTK